MVFLSSRFDERKAKAIITRVNNIVAEFDGIDIPLFFAGMTEPQLTVESLALLMFMAASQ